MLLLAADDGAVVRSCLLALVAGGDVELIAGHRIRAGHAELLDRIGQAGLHLIALLEPEESWNQEGVLE